MDQTGRRSDESFVDEFAEGAQHLQVELLLISGRIIHQRSRELLIDAALRQPRVQVVQQSLYRI